MKKKPGFNLFIFISIVFLLNSFAVARAEAGANQSETSEKPLTIEFVISETCSLVGFVDIISDHHHTTTWVKDWYHKQCLEDPQIAHEDAAFLRDYRSLMDGSEYKFTDETGRELDLNGKITCLAAGCSNLAELFPKCEGAINEKDVHILRRVLEHFSPIYEKLIWKPRLDGLKKQLDDCSAEAKRSNMSEQLAVVQKFMRAPWIPGLPIVVVLTPLPGDDESTSGQSLGSTQIVELLPKSKFENFADVVVHEACHAIWFSIPDHAIGVDRKFMLPDGRMLPMTEMYEGMATAIGQGWFSKKAFGHTPKNWYRDVMIERYSRAAYPLYASYLDSGRSMDDNFFKQATRIYFKKFPQAANDISLISGFFVSGDVIPDLLKAGVEKRLPRLRELNISHPLDSADGLETFRKMRTEHACFMVAPSALNRLSGFGISAEQMKVVQTANKSKPIVLKVGDKEVLFCVADTPEQQQELLFSALNKSKWPPLSKSAK